MIDITRYHPDAVGLNLKKRLPARLRTLLEFVSVFLAWFGLVQSVVSILERLSWVRDAGLWLYQHASELKPALLRLAEAIHVCVELWRRLTAPIYDFVFSALPFAVPPIAGDVILVLLIGAGGYFRYWLMKRSFEREARKDSLLIEDLHLQSQFGQPAADPAQQGAIAGWSPNSKAEEMVRVLEQASEQRLRGLRSMRIVLALQTALSVGLLSLSLLGEWIYVSGLDSH